MLHSVWVDYISLFVKLEAVIQPFSMTIQARPCIFTNLVSEFTNQKFLVSQLKINSVHFYKCVFDDDGFYFSLIRK